MTYDPNQPRDRGRFARKPSSDPGTDIGLDKNELELVVNKQRSIGPGDDIAAELWVRDGGVPVGYIHVMHKPTSKPDEALVLCDIEVRPDHRGKGIAGRMIRAVEEKYGERMYTTGSFTPAGYAALAGKIPVMKWYRENNDTDEESLSGTEFSGSHVDFEDMTFVSDWDEMQGKFPL